LIDVKAAILDLLAKVSGKARYINMQKVKDLTPVTKYGVGGTDLGIPFTLENGSTGYLFGDTFSSLMPGGANWRSPVALRSHEPIENGIEFDSAYKLAGEGLAPEIIANQHNTSGNGEFTIIPNDGISFPETGRQIISYMSVRNWDNGTWRTNNTGFAYSDNGNDFVKLNWQWNNNWAGTDILQMVSMQREGNWVYLLSTSNGRHLTDGLYLRRVPWDKMFDPFAYEHWTWNGTWQWTKNYNWFFHPILAGRFGEPSLRKLKDGRWVISVIDAANDRLSLYDAPTVTSVWNHRTLISNTSSESIYGGFVHPNSTSQSLHVILSKWNATKYGCEQWKTSL